MPIWSCCKYLLIFDLKLNISVITTWLKLCQTRRCHISADHTVLPTFYCFKVKLLVLLKNYNNITGNR